jgi:Skp family chaperone for outer membrane proteins
MNFRQRFVYAVTLAIAALFATGVCAQERPDDDTVRKKIEAQLREKEEALQKMAAQLEAQRAELDAKRAALAAQLEAQQKGSKERQKQTEAKQKSYQDALDLFGEPHKNPTNAAIDYSKIQEQMDAVRRQMAQQEGWKQKWWQPPLPENAETRIFALKYSKLPEVSRVLGEIVGDRGMRIAGDERTNSLVVSADQNTMGIVQALLEQLDNSPGGMAEVVPFGTLQLRIMWFVDGVEGSVPDESQVSPQVLAALRQLGLDNPPVVCQQVTTLTLGENNRKGPFQFSVPVLINGQLWELDGNGFVTPAVGDRLALQFEMQFGRTDGSDQAKVRRSRLGGSIHSPLGHYTVMGTSTLVDDADGKDSKPKQHPSAFVVYLDRAPDFPATKPAESAPPRR